MKLTKLLVAVLAVNQCDAVADYCVVTAAKVGTDLVAGKTLEGTGSAVLQAAAAINPLAAAGILATAWTASTVADSYFEHQTLQAEELTKQAKELTKQAEARAKQAKENKEAQAKQAEELTKQAKEQTKQFEEQTKTGYNLEDFS